MREIEEAWRKGHPSCLYAGVTGSGKSMIALRLALGEKRTAFMSTRRLLVEQILQSADRAGLAVAEAGRTKPGQWPPGVQFLAGTPAAMNRRLSEDRKNRPDLLVVDEAHHAAVQGNYRRCNTSARIAMRMRAAGCRVLGMTATPWRLEEDYGFEHVFSWMVRGPSYAELVRQGFVAEMRIVTLEQHLRTTKRQRSHDYDPYEIERRSEKRWLYGSPIRALLDATDGLRIPSISYCLFQRHALRFAQELGRAAGPETARRIGLLTSTRQPDETIAQDEVGARFRRGSLSALVNVAMVTEGYDVPHAEVVLCVRPTASQALWRQIAGRLARPAGGKGHGLLLDAAGNLERLGDPTETKKWRLYSRDDARALDEMCERLRAEGGREARQAKRERDLAAARLAEAEDALRKTREGHETAVRLAAERGAEAAAAETERRLNGEMLRQAAATRAGHETLVGRLRGELAHAVSQNRALRDETGLLRKMLAGHGEAEGKKKEAPAGGKGSGDGATQQRLPMPVGKPALLEDGRWGAMVRGVKVQPGTIIRIVARSGKEWTRRVREIIESNAEATVVRLQERS